MNCVSVIRHGTRNVIPDGFLDLQAGYAESGRVVSRINPVGEIDRCGIAEKAASLPGSR